MATTETATRTRGLACRRCGSLGLRTSEQTFKDGSTHLRCECAGCGRFLRYLPREQARVELDSRVGHPAYEPVPGGTRWGGWIRQDGHTWRPVALADSLEACWDVLLTTWQKGDMLCMPCEPRAAADEDDETDDDEETQ